MRTLKPLLLLVFAAVALPAFAARGRDQSYVTFDEGNTTIRQGDDGREVEARVNFPIYPGDEVTTGNRGRTEIRLADGNIIALDRGTSVRFQSIYDSYESDSMQSVVEFKYGQIAVQRTDDATELLRVDTPNASYAATEEAVYAVDGGSKGRERVTVYDGWIEVRTPERSTRLNRGEEARVDDQGLYGLTDAPADSADEFERWFLRRSERYGATSRYLDRSLAYSDADLSANGSWIYMSGYGGYAWRPSVSVGWRPYYNGRWGYGPGGCLTWISYEPWGWVPYHYGRWTYDPVYGWLWLPGYSYSPAWVYWAYGPGYIGWAPAGWYDCYRPYYGWAYQPYQRAGFDFGFGFYGRVRLNEVDLRPWTFVNPNSIVSNRVDQAALTTDAIRERLIRNPNAALATVTGTPARFTRSEIRDPGAAVNNIVQRGIVGGTTRPGGDMTPFFRRDTDLSPTIRERVVRSRAPEPVSGVGAGAGVPTPGTRGTIEGRVDRDGTTSRGDARPGEATGRVFRDPYGAGTSATRDGGTSQREATPSQRSPQWRDRVDRTPSTTPPSNSGGTPATVERPSRDNWRGRSVDRGSTPGDSKAGRNADIPRRIIDRIGGARISPGEGSRESAPPREVSRPRSDPPRESTPRYEPPPRQERSSSPPPQQERPSSPPPRQEHSSPPPASSDHGGGRVRRN